MIKILANKYSYAVTVLSQKLDNVGAKYDVFISENDDSIVQFVRDAVKCDSLIAVGNVWGFSSLFATTFGLSMFYDTYAEKCIKAYCTSAKCEVPAQYVMDKLCSAPESFNHIASVYGFQCSCTGLFGNCKVYFLPDDNMEVQSVFDGCIIKNISGKLSANKLLQFKIFGLTKNDILAKLKKVNVVSHSCETIALDTSLTIELPKKCSEEIKRNITELITNLFGKYIYATKDVSLEKAVIDLLNSKKMMLSTAESITGGLIASSLVSVGGASKVFYEGLVTYSIPSKCARLGLSPHFVDEHGVVSKQVAEKMASGLLANGSDVAVATTGYAGPTADNGSPVGLCYISVATKNGTSTYSNVFNGERNSIRQQASNMALFLLYNKLK